MAACASSWSASRISTIKIITKPPKNNLMNTRNIYSLICLLAWTVSLSASAAEKTLEQKQTDFRELEFGMFIHYNMATYTGKQWVEGYPDPSTFNPGGKVDTDAWADAAVSAGMTYGVLTVKHVAGFCLWDSEYTTYDVMHPDCPYQQDLVAQFIESFKSRGLKVGLYYCWRHPGFDTGKNKGKFKVIPPEV
jgi:alpha-L-fucosidase